MVTGDGTSGTNGAGRRGRGNNGRKDARTNRAGKARQGKGKSVRLFKGSGLLRFYIIFFIYRSYST